MAQPVKTTQYRPVLKGFETQAQVIQRIALARATQYRPVLKGFETSLFVGRHLIVKMLRSTAPF